MQNKAGLFELSASDIANHLSCQHLTGLNRALAEGRLEAPKWPDPMLAVLRKRGLAHEEGYLAHLCAKGLQVVQPEEGSIGLSTQRTLAAMRSGADVIVQAELQSGRWVGRLDFLRRVKKPGKFGNWSYEVVDTKLGQNTRAGTILQLCQYSNLLADLQGVDPEHMYVVKPGDPFEEDEFRLADFQAYYRFVRRSLEDAVDREIRNSTYPNPVPHCDICRWWQHCDSRRRQDDHLCLVAGIQSLHITELNRQGIDTLEQFADEPKSLREKPERGNIETFTRIQKQARIQLEGRRKALPVYELLPPEQGRGLLLLPEPSRGDIFFDIEGNHSVVGGGLEYLFGYCFTAVENNIPYRSLWALNLSEERRVFEEFIDFVINRWRQYPDMHIYHFAPYEPAALKRLMGRHATREAEVDRLLRGGRFVDLYAAVRQGVRASVERYSIKDLERFYDFSRNVELRSASIARHRLEYILEFGAAIDIPEEIHHTVEEYNKDDCISTLALRDWLETLRIELQKQGHEVPRPQEETGEATEAVAAREERVQQVYDQLLHGLPQDRSVWTDEEQARWFLAHQLDYFRREDRCAWWEFFRLHQLDDDELLEERKAAVGLEFVEVAGGTEKCPVHRYSFPPQEVSFSEGDELHEVGGLHVGSVKEIDYARRTLDIKKKGSMVDIHPSAVLVNERVSPHPLDGSLLDLARCFAEEGLDNPTMFLAARDLLLKRPPHLFSGENGSLKRPEEDAVQAAVRLVTRLDNSFLAIQGPPGTGKTYAGARLIVELVRSGKRVGVTAVSHKVIRNLLVEVLKAARESGHSLEVTHKVTKRAETTPDDLTEVTSASKAFAALDDGKVLGGTAWLWARDDAVESVDYLIVDEAGQISLALVLAASRSAYNLILLGDPQQLEQPQRGAHPEGADVAALVHVLDSEKTMPEDKGLFLEVSWRLHPDICAFTSELYYESRLSSLPSLENQVIRGETPFAGSGLFYTPVEHTGNQNSSSEEVAAVESIVTSLLRPGISWVDRKGENHGLRPEDILIVAPYNAQVGALADRLSGLRVGTVDKFQGQEAPVVIYAMASSSAEDAPRGMSFLYSPNRFNVASSRARCVCILVGSPRLFEPECRTPDQMRWANGLCRFRELATVVDVDRIV